MTIRYFFIKSGLLTLILTACGTVENRYTDNDSLERPPILATTAPQSDQALSEPQEAPKKRNKGLGDDVSINSDSVLQLRLKRSFDIAWHDLELILKQKDIEIKDREHDKGQYYVMFDADDYQPEDSGFLAKSASLFKNEYKPVIYILTVEKGVGTDAVINAVIADDTEQTTHGSAADKDSHLTDGANKLLLSLYKSLRDDLVEE